MRRRLSMGPATRSNPEAGDPMHRPPAGRAVKHLLAQLALQVSLHPEKFEAQYLRVNHQRIGPAEPGCNRLVHEPVCLQGLLGDGPHGGFQNASFSLPHGSGKFSHPDLTNDGSALNAPSQTGTAIVVRPSP
jgi:hypothetical protein